MSDYTVQTNRLGEAGQAMIDFVEELDRLTRLSRTGISMITGVPAAVKALGQATGEEGGDYEAKLIRAERIATLAKSEMETGFTMLFAHSAVGLWSALEATISRMATYWLCDSSIGSEKLSRTSLRLPVSVFFNSPKESLAGHVVDEVLASCPDGRGIGKFEFLLDKIGLGGGFDNDLRKTLFELSHVRNLVVHQMSVVDEKFKLNCPWVDAKIDSRLAISDERYKEYKKAAVIYLTEVIKRALAAAQNISLEEVELQLTKKPASNVSK